MSQNTTPPVSELRPSVRVNLPSGGWVQLRAEDDLRSYHREVVADAIPNNMGAGDVVRMLRVVGTVMIVAWEIPYLPGAPLPSDNADILKELRVLDENKLITVFEPIIDLLNPNNVDPADFEDPDSPTAPAAG